MASYNARFDGSKVQSKQWYNLRPIIMLPKLPLSIVSIEFRSDLTKFASLFLHLFHPNQFFCFVLIFPFFLLTSGIAWQKNCIIFRGFYCRRNTFEIFGIRREIIVGLDSNNVVTPNQNNHHGNIMHRKLTLGETHVSFSVYMCFAI